MDGRYLSFLPCLCCARSGATNKRRMSIPGDLMEKFLLIAAPNTAVKPRGLETCGILGGQLVRWLSDDPSTPYPASVL
jgi:hypothetical protein